MNDLPTNPPDAERFPLAPEGELQGGASEPNAQRGPEPAPAAGLKKRVIPDPPEIDQTKGRQTLWFLLVLALAAFAVMAAVGTLNTLADPYGMIGMKLLPSATTSDRTIKADAIEALKQGPELVVLGSSRSMRYQPKYLEEKTGLRTFNAGVNGIGGTADAWAMTNFIADTWPDASPAYFWLLDVESFVPFKVQGRTANEPRLAQYVGEAGARRSARALLRAVAENRTAMFSWVTAKDSLRVILNRDKAKVKASKYRDTFLPDGMLKQRLWTEKEWAKRFPKAVKRYGDLYRNAYKELDPEAQSYFERTLKLMNDQGATPLIVLTPINPKLLKVLSPLGWPLRYQQVLDYVTSLEGTYDFVFVDITDMTKFGADPVQFYDGVHLTTINTQRAIDYVLRQTGGLPK
jgi:hypothetical protein